MEESRIELCQPHSHLLPAVKGVCCCNKKFDASAVLFLSLFIAAVSRSGLLLVSERR